MRRTVPLLLALLLPGACSSGSTPAATPSHVTSVRPGAELPAAVRDFLGGVAEGGTVAFRATYAVERKLGGQTSTVTVVAAPPSWQVRVDDLVVVDGPKQATCRISKRQCVRGIRDPLLAPTGVFSRFFSTAPASALSTDARRLTAGALQLSTQTVAGISLHCAAVPISGNVASTYCLTPDGVFGLVDTPAVHYELRDYAPGAPGVDAGVPYTLGTDDRFLTAP